MASIPNSLFINLKAGQLFIIIQNEGDPKIFRKHFRYYFHLYFPLCQNECYTQTTTFLSSIKSRDYV